jgi:hypothetical protein
VIGLRMQGFTYTEMMNWTDEIRNDWYNRAVEMNEQEAAEYEKMKGGTPRHRSR